MTNEEKLAEFAGEVLCHYKYQNYSGPLEEKRREILRLISGEPPQPRCPKCGSEKVEFGFSFDFSNSMGAYVACFGNCNGRRELVHKLSDFTQFLGPSAPSGSAGPEVIKPPFQKALTVIMTRDESDEQAEKDLRAIADNKSTVVRIGVPELYFHHLRLRVAEDPPLADKIAVFYMMPSNEMREVGLKFDNELKWPAGFCQEHLSKEIDIMNARKKREPEGRAESAAEPGISIEQVVLDQRTGEVGGIVRPVVSASPAQTCPDERKITQTGPNYSELASVTSATEKPTVSAMPTWANPPKVEEIVRQIEAKHFPHLETTQKGEAEIARMRLRMMVEDILAILGPLFTQVSQAPQKAIDYWLEHCNNDAAPDWTKFPVDVQHKMDAISVEILSCAFAAEEMHGELFDAKYLERNVRWNRAMVMITELLKDAR